MKPTLAIILIVTILLPSISAHSSTTFVTTGFTGSTASSSTRYLSISPFGASGTSTVLDQAIDGSQAYPYHTTIQSVTLFAIGPTGARTVNPLAGGENLTLTLKRAALTGTVWTDAGTITDLGVITSATTFPFTSNQTLNLDISNQTLYVQATANALLLPRTFTYNVRLDMTMGDFCRSTCNLTGNFTGNFTGNVAFTELDGMIQTAFDPYIEVILFGILLILFLLKDAWFPAFMALLSLGETILPTDVWRFEASVMLISIGLILHALIIWRFGWSWYTQAR